MVRCLHLLGYFHKMHMSTDLICILVGPILTWTAEHLYGQHKARPSKISQYLRNQWGGKAWETWVPRHPQYQVVPMPMGKHLPSPPLKAGPLVSQQGECHEVRRRISKRLTNSVVQGGWHIHFTQVPLMLNTPHALTCLESRHYKFWHCS